MLRNTASPTLFPYTTLFRSDSAQRGAAGGELHLKLAHGKNGFGHRSFGLRASRSQSPSRLMERIRAASAMPGKATIHHSPANGGSSDRKSTRLNSSHMSISYAVFCLKKKKKKKKER